MQRKLGSRLTFKITRLTLALYLDIPQNFEIGGYHDKLLGGIASLPFEDALREATSACRDQDVAFIHSEHKLNWFKSEAVMPPQKMLS